jgi:Serine acetyltransferase, N-terminal
VHHISCKLANDSVSSGEWYKLLDGVLREPCGQRLGELMRADLEAILARDPACEGPAHAALNYKVRVDSLTSKSLNYFKLKLKG